MKKRIRKSRNFLMMGIFILTFLMTPQSVIAAERTGSLTVYYHGITPHGNQISLSGAEFSVYKVAERVENQWVLQGAFEKTGVSLKDMSSSGQKKVAEQLNQFTAKEKLEGEIKTTGEDGKVVFYNLEESMYLCTSDDDVVHEDGVFRSAPFLVFIPEVDENGKYLYDVLVEPKNEWVSDDKEPEEKPEDKPEDSSSKGENAKTGDDAPVELLVKILAVSVIMIILLMFWRNHDKKDEEQSNE